MPVHVFLSYNHAEELQRSFVQKVWSYLGLQPDIEPFFYPEAEPEHQVGNFWETVSQKLVTIRDNGGLFIAFVGRKLGATQLREMTEAQSVLPNNRRIWVCLAEPDECDPDAEFFCADHHSIDARSTQDPAAETCAYTIVGKLGRPWHPPRGIPPGYPFAFEKEIIRIYGSGQEHRWLPAGWPQPTKWPGEISNPIDPAHIGAYRSEDAAVVVHARMEQGRTGAAAADGRPLLTFPEAGPRALLRFPRSSRHGLPVGLRVGILVSGGIAPGINAVIEAVVARHRQYMNAHNEKHPSQKYRVKIHGYLDGLKALTADTRGHRDLHDDAGREAVLARAQLGGSLLGTSRVESLLELSPESIRRMRGILDRVGEQKLDILYVIGGDGSMRAAHAISVEAARHEDSRVRQLCVIGIPKTMDNDILWVWQSFGFHTAVDEATRITRGLHTEATSNPRLAVIQLFGSDSGFVVSHAALGSGVCDAALIPEVPFSLQKLSRYMCSVLLERLDAPDADAPHGLIVMAETAIPTDFELYLDDRDVALSPEERNAVLRFVNDGRRVRGQTPDLLRTAALKMVSRVLERDVRRIGEGDEQYWRMFRVFTNEPRHIIRSSAPTVVDTVLAGRLGTLAVDSAMAGYSDVMVSQWLTEYVLVPMELVVLGRKRVPQDGIFWKSVLASLEAHSTKPADFFQPVETVAQPLPRDP
ncbi:MAG TPA: 6-phosphofructokinase [Micromonosporaceae bacterium]|nr:6-phosphofructokinase [Micromonosporaceae bacterium]